MKPNLDRPGRRYLYAQGKNYFVYAHIAGSLEMERHSDGATLLFQGENADRLRLQLEAADDLTMTDDQSLRLVDLLCSCYDDVLLMPVPEAGSSDVRADGAAEEMMAVDAPIPEA